MRKLITFKFFALIHWTPAFAGVTNDGCHCGMVPCLNHAGACLSRNPVYQKIISANFFVRSLILSTLSTIALLMSPLSLSAQNTFSLSLDVNGAAGDQAVTSLNMSADQIVAIQIFGTGIQNANGLAARFEYDASQVVYRGFDASDVVLPNAQALPEEGTGFVEIGIASLGGQATANSGLVGTVRFRTTAAIFRYSDSVGACRTQSGRSI